MEGQNTQAPIVIAEDSLTQATLLQNSLENMGYLVHCGKNGKEALELAEKYKPLMVISDVVMPEMGGYELIRNIRKNKEISNTPVLLLTSLSGLDDIMRGLENGADSYLLKPFNEDYLQARVQQILENQAQLIEGRDDTPIQVSTAENMFEIRSGAPAILNLLFSSYESAVTRNLDLESQQQEILEINELLHQKVEQRKADLEEEIRQVSAAEKALKTSEERYRDLVDHAQVGIFIWDSEGKVIQCNDCFLELLRLDSRKDADLKDIRIFFLPNSKGQDLFQELEKTGSVNEFETLLLDRNGSKSTVLVSAGRSEGLISGMLLDISDRKLTEERLKTQGQQLLKAKETAESSEKLKTAFLANMSNEILNPLNSVLGFSDLMNNDGVGQEELEHYTEQINRSSNHLINITESIIDIARVETGELKIQKTPCFLNSLLLDVFSQSKKMIEVSSKSSIELLLNREIKDPDLSFITEPFRLKRIISNLLENAIKFTDKGVIEFGFTINQMKGSIDEEEIQFYVKDTGRGIEQAKLELIFDRFRQNKTSYVKMSEGAGLGLPLTRAYVELLGGKMWCNSEPGQGTEFYFTLPFIPVKGASPPKKNIIHETNPLPEKHLNILIAEDQESNYVLIEAMLAEMNCTLIWVKNGQEALQLFKRQKNIHLILMDLRMPVMNGFEAVEEIRKINSSVPIIVLTAFAREEDRESILNLGCNSFLTKPVRKQSLYTEIYKFTSVQNGP